MNIKLETNRYILKGTRKWHDFMHSNISIPMFLACFVFMFLIMLMVITVLSCGIVW